jgi:peptide/nickel transport system permease protein
MTGLLRSPVALASGLVLAALALLALLAPWLAPHPPGAVVTSVFAPADATAWLGGDSVGRDLFSRTLHGLRLTLGIALVVTLGAAAVGIGLALWAALRRGWVDMVLGRLVDTIMAVPQIILALLVLAVLGVSLGTLVGTMIVLEATLFYRVLRPAAGDVAAMEFMEVARLRGEGALWTLRHEMLPNLAPTVLAEVGIRFAFAALFVSALSFLGVGIQPPAADLGGLVRENALAISSGRLAPLVPALAIALIAISVNGLVDAAVRRYSLRAELTP